jgi:hypothetical protein
MTPMILIFASDVSHHPLESCGVPFLIVLVNKIGVDHFMNQSPFNLINIIIHLAEQLVRQVNLIRLNGLPFSDKCFGKATSFVSAATSGCGHSSIPQNRKVRNLAIEMLIIQPDKYCFDVGSD